MITMVEMELNIINMYPDILNMYGDIGNLICIKQRAMWRGIKVNIQEITLSNETTKIDENTDMVLIGGGSDNGQTVVANNLLKQKQSVENYIENNGVLLAICGSYQMFGQTYIDGDGNNIPCSEIFDIETISQKERLIGDIVLKSNINLSQHHDLDTIIGFENHGGRTYHKYDKLGTVEAGFGNNGKDEEEGMIYNNFIGSYLHGPLLPKNPHLADYMILKALQNKYEIDSLEQLNDEIEINAHKSRVNTILTK